MATGDTAYLWLDLTKKRKKKKKKKHTIYLLLDLTKKKETYKCSQSPQKQLGYFE